MGVHRLSRLSLRPPRQPEGLHLLHVEQYPLSGFLARARDARTWRYRDSGAGGRQSPPRRAAMAAAGCGFSLRCCVRARPSRSATRLWRWSWSTGAAGAAHRALWPDGGRSRTSICCRRAAGHLLGTDGTGMDIFSRVISAPRVDLTIAVLGTLLSAVDRHVRSARWPAITRGSAPGGRALSTFGHARRRMCCRPSRYSCSPSRWWRCSARASAASCSRSPSSMRRSICG